MEPRTAVRVESVACRRDAVSAARRTMRRDVERAVRKGQLRVEEGKALMKFYIEGLEGYTYLE